MISGLVYNLLVTVGIVTLVLAGIPTCLYLLLKRREEQKLEAVKIRTRSERRAR